MKVFLPLIMFYSVPRLISKFIECDEIMIFFASDADMAAANFPRIVDAINYYISIAFHYSTPTPNIFLGNSFSSTAASGTESAMISKSSTLSFSKS